MKIRMPLLAAIALFLGHVVTVAAQDDPAAKDTQASPQNGAVGAPAGGFQWPSATTGELEVKKGKIDKFEAGKVETGGVLGLGGTDLSISGDTMIVSEDGKKLSRSDLKPGAEIASIYKEDDKTDKNIALVVIVSRAQQSR